MNKTFERLDKVIAELKNDVLVADKNYDKNKSKRFALKAIIDSPYFTVKSDLFADYLAQLLNTESQLKKTIVEKKEIETLQLIEYLQNQISALTTAIKSQATRNKFYQPPIKQLLKRVRQTSEISLYDLHQKLLEYRGYEIRLVEMLNHHHASTCLNSRQSNEHMLDNRSQALHQRLANCRKAILDVEKQIQYLENKKR